MANESITFSCAACGIKLTVPANLAGVSGPCPSCRAQIQAPLSNPTPYAPVPAPVPAPVYQAEPSLVKPEPRQLPSRLHSTEVVAKQMPEPNGSGSKGPAPLGKHPHEKSVFYRFSILLVFLVAAIALMYGVVKFLTAEPTTLPTQNPAKTQPIAKPQPSPTQPAEPPNPTPPIKSLPTPAPAQPTLIEPLPSPPEGIDVKPPAMLALDVLEKFLTAKTLAERLPIIETKTPEAEIAASCLANPLPATKSMVIDAQESNPTEEVIDFYFNVDFEAENGRTKPQTILLRSRGGSDPKVVVDPFLDLYGGRLAAYAAKPTDKAETFQVIANAVASCTDPLITNRDKKLTLKLLARDNTKEVAQAYFGKLSKIGEMLNDGTYSLSYGKAKSCTVMLRWNIEDNPQHPYLEAIQIKALDWNP